LNTGKIKNTIVYVIMNGERKVATLSSVGDVIIYSQQFMPYDLYLEEETDLDTKLNNLYNFYFWCASRVLPIDRKFIKDILSSIGATQAVTDKDRARIALSYHCVSLTDVFWVKTSDENICFSEINLYDHSLNEAIVPLSLMGKQMTVTNKELAADLSTKGCFPKAWIRTETGFKILKGGDDAVARELLASKICRCFDFNQVLYEPYHYNGQLVSISELITSKDFSIVTKMAFDIYACNHDIDTIEVCLSLDPSNYFGMNILDYLVGNTDRHPENWGFLVDNHTNNCIALHALMDFNKSFHAYDTIEGAVCQTSFPARMSQKEAAVCAVSKIGLRQIQEIDPEWFADMPEVYEMFKTRLELLKSYEPKV